MSKKRGRKKGGGDDPFPNYWAEVAAVPWKRFSTCTFEEFVHGRLHIWKLDSKIMGIMRVYYHDGPMVEHVIKKGTDIQGTIRSVLKADRKIKIVYADHDQCVHIYAADSDDDDGGPPVPSL